MTPESNDLFDVMYHCRAMRRLKTDPVPDELIVKLIDAGNQAPSGSNQQGARWIAVKDPSQKAKLAELNQQAVKAYTGVETTRLDSLPHQPSDKRQRMLNAVLWQAEHMHELPVLLIACFEFPAPVSNPSGAAGSVWPGVQNVLLAARALGLGAAPTTLGLINHDAVKEILSLPDNVAAFVLVPVGWPLGNFGPVTRLPVDQTMHWDRWAS